MTQAGFIAALAANIAFGSYDSPATIGACQSEWIIVSSWGANGDFLSLSHTSVVARRLGSAPRGLQPTATYLGILLVRNLTAGNGESEYLLLRNRPPEVVVGGVFHPSDGYVRVHRQNGEMRLTARGRYAHCHGTRQGESVVCDIPDPAPGYEKARSWHLDAVQRPWIGEFTPDGEIGSKGCIVRIESPRKPPQRSTDRRSRALDALPA